MSKSLKVTQRVSLDQKLHKGFYQIKNFREQELPLAISPRPHPISIVLCNQTQRNIIREMILLSSYSRVLDSILS